MEAPSTNTGLRRRSHNHKHAVSVFSGKGPEKSVMLPHGSRLGQAATGRPAEAIASLVSAPGPQHPAAHVGCTWLTQKLDSNTDHSVGMSPPHPLHVLAQSRSGPLWDPPLQHVLCILRGTLVPVPGTQPVSAHSRVMGGASEASTGPRSSLEKNASILCGPDGGASGAPAQHRLGPTLRDRIRGPADGRCTSGH